MNDIVLPEFPRNCSGLEFAINTRERLRFSSSRGRSTAYVHLPGRQEIFGNAALSTVVEPICITDPGNQDEGFSQNADAQEISNGASYSEKCRGRIASLHLKRAKPSSRISNQSPCGRLAWLEQTCGLLYMSAQPNRDLGEVADFL